MERATIQVTDLTKDYVSYRKEAGLWNSVKGLFHRESFTTRAVDAVSFSIAEGEIVGFLGPNGAGKTTTLKMLAGILYPTSGTATVLGFEPWERRREYQKQFAIVMGQKNQLWWDLPAADSFLLFKEMYEIPDRAYHERIDELATLLGVNDVLTVPVRKLSLGQRMKCELIGALIHHPKVLFLDEPTIGLDVVSQAKIREFLRTYNERERTTIVLTSHYMEDVKALAKRVIIIDHGRVVYDGSLQSLTDTYGDRRLITLTFNEKVAKNTLEKLGQLVAYAGTSATIEVPKLKAARVTARLLERFPIDDVTIAQPDADEVIRDIFEGRTRTKPRVNHLASP
jgi:ABC-2 type transport system ATP-binding protein